MSPFNLTMSGKEDLEEKLNDAFKASTKVFILISSYRIIITCLIIQVAWLVFKKGGKITEEGVQVHVGNYDATRALLKDDEVLEDGGIGLNLTARVVLDDKRTRFYLTGTPSLSNLPSRSFLIFQAVNNPTLPFGSIDYNFAQSYYYYKVQAYFELRTLV